MNDAKIMVMFHYDAFVITKNMYANIYNTYFCTKFLQSVL